jgi:hypothetical protein
MLQQTAQPLSPSLASPEKFSTAQTFGASGWETGFAIGIEAGDPIALARASSTGSMSAPQQMNAPSSPLTILERELIPAVAMALTAMAAGGSQGGASGAKLSQAEMSAVIDALSDEQLGRAAAAVSVADKAEGLCALRTYCRTYQS